MNKPDLTYSAPDGFWTRFYPITDAGADAWRVMANADQQGVVAFPPWHVADVLRQLRAAGLSVHKAKPAKPATIEEIDALLAELES